MRCLAVAAWLIAAAVCPAWNKAGHMVGSAITYQLLTAESPRTLERCLALLRAHPHYESQWLARVRANPDLTPAERDLLLFMQAARWPDDVRSGAEYHQPTWHYLNKPFQPPGQPDSVRVRGTDPDNIVRAYAANLVKLRDQTAPAADRAVALCWVLHLIGDAHQPLHAVNLFSEQFPRGDRGGSLFFIRAGAGSAAITLHKFWDDLIIGTQRFQAVRNRATELRLRPALARDRLHELAVESFESWVTTESYGLACRVAYRDGRLAGGTAEGNAVVLPGDYAATVQPIAERRIVLSGYRAAKVLHHLE